MPVKVLASVWDVLFGGASDVGGSDDDVARGIRYAADNGAKIINMSLGSSGPPNCATNPNQSGCSPVIEAAMRYAVGKGCFIAVAAGNEFEVNDPPFGLNPTSVIAEIASRIPGAVSVQGGRSRKDRRLLLERRALRRNRRRRADRSAASAATASSGSRPSTSRSPTPSICRRLSTTRRASTCSATSATSERRWRRRTSRALRPC